MGGKVVMSQVVEMTNDYNYMGYQIRSPIQFRLVDIKDPGLEMAIQSSGARLPVGKRLAFEVYEADPLGNVVGTGVRENYTLIGHVGIGDPAAHLGPRRNLRRDTMYDEFQRSVCGGTHAPPETVDVWLFYLKEHKYQASLVLKSMPQGPLCAWREAYGWWPKHWEAVCRCETHGMVYKIAKYRTLGHFIDREGGFNTMLYRGPLHRITKRPSIQVEPVKGWGCGNA
jgi:hypothetical protein